MTPFPNPANKPVHPSAALSYSPLVPFSGYPSKYDFGTPASKQEIGAMTIAIPADGKGLPPGRGDYAAGKTV
jgi:hypothetical protein